MADELTCSVCENEFRGMTLVAVPDREFKGNHLMCERCSEETDIPSEPAKPFNELKCEECSKAFPSETNVIVACCCGSLVLCERCSERRKVGPDYHGMSAKCVDGYGRCFNKDCNKLVCEDNCTPGSCEKDGCNNMICEYCRYDEPFQVCACDQDYFCPDCVARMKKCKCGRPLCGEHCKELCSYC